MAELRALGSRPYNICTGQHTDLLLGTPAETDLGRGVSLRCASTGDIQVWGESAEPRLRTTLKNLKNISLVTVQGDTISAMLGARVANELKIPVAHVEAG